MEWPLPPNRRDIHEKVLLRFWGEIAGRQPQLLHPQTVSTYVLKPTAG